MFTEEMYNRIINEMQTRQLLNYPLDYEWPYGELNEEFYKELRLTREAILENQAREAEAKRRKREPKRLADGGGSRKKKETKKKDDKEPERVEFKAVPSDLMEKIILESKIDFTKVQFAIDVIESYRDLYHLSDNEFKKRSGISRQEYSKIRNKACIPKKNTLFQIAIGLGLTPEQCEILLRSSGYTFNLSETMDVLILKCLKYGINHISNVNDIMIEMNFDDKELFPNHFDFDIRKSK